MRSARVLAASIVLAWAACNAPTLPLPPPVVESVSFPDAANMVTVRGQVLERAIVLCYNDRTKIGVIVTADDAGFFSLQIQALIGDHLTIWQEVGNDRSPPVGKVVGEDGGGDPDAGTSPDAGP